MSSTVWPILKREYFSRVKTKAFWVSTALVPIFIFAMTIVPSLLAARSKASNEPVRILDALGDFAPVAREVLADSKRGADQPPIEIHEVVGRSSAELRRENNDLAAAGDDPGLLPDRPGGRLRRQGHLLGPQRRVDRRGLAEQQPHEPDDPHLPAQEARSGRSGDHARRHSDRLRHAPRHERSEEGNERHRRVPS